MKSNNNENIYTEALVIASNHYENFPVISFFIPKRLRNHIAVIYVFARQADDLADEGDFTSKQRLEELDKFEKKFLNALDGKYENSFWNALHQTINTKELNPDDFLNLLKAFKQDTVKKRYSNFDELLDYCKNSANPVGRIILDIFDIKDEKLKEYSDNICTALQLTNFYQDVSIDYKKGRIYIPLDELKLFDIDENIFGTKINKDNFKSLMEFQIKRTELLFENGSKLITHLPKPLSYEIKWTVMGGKNILEKIRKYDYDVLNQRPILSKINYFSLMLKAFLKG